MIRHPIDLRLAELDHARARAAVLAHHRLLPYPGDSFLPSMQLAGTAMAILIDGEQVGTAVVAEGSLVLCTLTHPAKRHDRQVMELILSTFEVRDAFAASWDAHHLELFGSFSREIRPQAYQFQLLDPGPASALPDLTFSGADEADLPYLNGAGFLEDYSEIVPAGQVRIARRNGRAVGIGLLAPHSLDPTVINLGMFTEPDVRRQGVGTSIIALAAREAIDRSLTPVAGCWWRNWNSRPTLEAAGLTCVGTIFRIVPDPDAFAD